MAKTISEIEKMIESKAEEFYNFILLSIPKKISNAIIKIAKDRKIYIFSGIIRNYFLGINEIRDIDLVIDERVNIDDYFSGYHISQNSFGGYKVIVEGMPIDLWIAKDSWAYKAQKEFDFDLAKYIFRTAYFNFSAVLYSINERKFYYSKHFIRFLQSKEMDIVFPMNKNFDLCIINTMYYSEKYNLKISKKLANELLSYFYSNVHEYEFIQRKHFGNILYDIDQINEFEKKIIDLATF